MYASSVKADLFNIVILIESQSIYTLVDPQAGTGGDPGINFKSPLQADGSPACMVIINIFNNFLLNVIVFILVVTLV